MKKIVFISVAIIIAFSLWTIIPKPRPMPKNVIVPQNSFESTNSAINPLASNGLSQALNTNIFVRPDYIDKEQWDQLMLMRQIALEKNQPIKFYARVVDQNEQPVEGAKLHVKLSRIDENIFSTTNFFNRNSDDIVQEMHFDYISDNSGWIKLTGITGETLRIESLSKSGYSWIMPQIGSFSYEPGRKHRVGYAEMEDAFDSTKGYLLHLVKE